MSILLNEKALIFGIGFVLIFFVGGIWAVLKAVLLLLAGIIGLLVKRQDSILYIGATGSGKNRLDSFRPQFKPAYWKLPCHEVNFRAADGPLLHGWLICQPDSLKAPTIVFCHGNAGNINGRISNYLGLFHNVGQ